MMPSFIGATLAGVAPTQYTHDALFEDISRQMSTFASRRYSRGSAGAFTGSVGNAMRVSKPASANNSPRNNLMHQRRRTMMNDPLYVQRAQQMLEQPQLPTPGADMYGNHCYEPVKRSTRPISWHPTSQITQAQATPAFQPQMSQYPFPSYCDYDFYTTQTAQVPPTPAAFSAYSSPGSAFSPLQLPSYNTYELPNTYASPCWDVTAGPLAPAVTSTIHAQQTPDFVNAALETPAIMPEYAEPSFSPASWANLPPANYSQSVTAPPTPEDPPKAQQPAPVVVKQEPLGFTPPEEQDVVEDDGDILVGLGLYDPPERLGLLGASFQPTGKGLKLEDAWEPPATDDDEDDDDDEADDGEGDAESDQE